jgi:hypothetical protein
VTGEVDPGTVIGIGLTALLVLGGALWRAGALRGELNRDWASRVNAATTALTDRTIDELNALRRDTDQLLGPENAEDPPNLASVDPSPLVKRAVEAAGYYVARRKLVKYFDRLLWIAPLLVPDVLLLMVSDVALSLYCANIVHRAALLVIGLAALGLGVVAGILLAGLYLVTEHKLAGAEIQAQSGPTGSAS